MMVGAEGVVVQAGMQQMVFVQGFEPPSFYFFCLFLCWLCGWGLESTNNQQIIVSHTSFLLVWLSPY